jgi:hypothetical protein
MTEIEDKSLLRCTIKKSVDVFKKVVLCGLYSAVTIILITAIAAVGYLIWLGFNSSLATIIYSSIISLLVSIPWYVYVGVIALLAIPVYSLVWCIARELTKEDWESGEAATVSIISVIAITLGIIIIIIGIIIAISDTKTNAPAILIGLSAILIGVFFLLEGPKILLFPGAYLHYRKRMKLSGGVK